MSLWAEGAFPRHFQGPLIPREPLCEDNVLPSDTCAAGFHVKGGFIDIVNSPKIPRKALQMDKGPSLRTDAGEQGLRALPPGTAGSWEQARGFGVGGAAAAWPPADQVRVQAPCRA